MYHFFVLSFIFLYDHLSTLVWCNIVHFLLLVLVQSELSSRLEIDAHIYISLQIVSHSYLVVELQKSFSGMGQINNDASSRRCQVTNIRSILLHLPFPAIRVWLSLCPERVISIFDVIFAFFSSPPIEIVEPGRSLDNSRWKASIMCRKGRNNIVADAIALLSFLPLSLCFMYEAKLPTSLCINFLTSVFPTTFCLVTLTTFFVHQNTL